MTSVPVRYFRSKLTLWGILPLSRLTRFTLYVLASELVLFVLRGVVALAGGSTRSMDGWLVFLTVWAIILGSIVTLRWMTRVLLWRLRNRLLVTYIFIGVIPVLLIGVMALSAGYLFAGQFAALLARTNMDAELKDLQAINAGLSSELESLVKQRGATVDSLRATLPHRLYPKFAEAEFSAWYGDQQIFPKPDKAQQPLVRPEWVKESFAGVVIDSDRNFAMRAVSVVPVNGRMLTTVSSMPLNADDLGRSTGNLGEVTLFRQAGTIEAGNNLVQVGINDEEVKTSQEKPVVATEKNAAITSGTVPPAVGSFDRVVAFGTLLPVSDWLSGKQYSVFLQVSTRFSVLYERLFSTFSKLAGAIQIVIAALAIVLGIIELVALMIGLGLTRTITRSVAELYDGTQHVNRGDFQYRIKVKSQDQLAALETSFNSMTESLEKLIEEQKEKQRLQNELAIAQEVQAQLFPRQDLQLHSLELHGVCKPARTVSGDYYDFLPMGHERMALAVGDISGKGISAALLMATIHSAVRVYEFGGMPNGGALKAAAAAAKGMQQDVSMGSLADSRNGIQSPSQVLWLLNRHLFHSTPAEKYATLFLGLYDGEARKLTYSNAGHLPPLLIGADGHVRKLDTGGMVIGLFEKVSYEESAVELRPGELLVAYSDGITEPENDFGEFGEERLVQMLRENRQLPLARISEIVTSAVQDWTGAAEQPDDVTLVLARTRS